MKDKIPFVDADHAFYMIYLTQAISRILFPYHEPQNEKCKSSSEWY